MTAAQLAQLTHARRTGKGRWMARCVAHPDRHPSLSIAEGRRGVLVRCMSRGCDTREILRALGLKWGDLFHGPPPDAERLRRLEELEAIRDREKRERGAIASAALKRAYDWDAAAYELGRLLGHYPDDDSLAVLFHRALDYSRRAEAIAQAYFPPRLWGNGITAGCPYPWPTGLTRAEVGNEIAARLGIWR